MTCAYEEDLALHVERDLPASAVAALEAHLASCAPCRAFLAELRASQALVKDLASEEIEPEALASVRVRLVAAAGSPPPRVRGHVPFVAAAAAIILALGALGWIALRTPRVAPVAVGPGRPVDPSVIPPSRMVARESTPPASSPVSPGMERAHGRRGHQIGGATGRPPAAPALSPDDADQLARAVVAIAQIRSVDDVPPDVEAPPAAPLMRLATADPDVVIYWQLEPSGGE